MNNSKSPSVQAFFEKSFAKLNKAKESFPVNIEPDFNYYEKVFPQKFCYAADRKRGSFTYFNNKLLDIFGVNSDSVENLGFTGLSKLLVHPDDAYQRLNIYAHFEKFASDFTIEELKPLRLLRCYRLKDKTGKYRKVLDTSLILSVSENKDILSFMGDIQLAPMISEFNLATGVVINSQNGDELQSFNLKKESSNIALTKREVQVLRMIVSGKRNKEIAQLLFLSVYTVDTHRKNIMSKLGIKSPLELVWKALEMNLIHSD